MKEYFVLRGGHVVLKEGHYDLDGAEATAKRESQAHPKSLVHVVKIVDTYRKGRS